MAEWLCGKRRTNPLTLQRTSNIKSKKLNKNVREVRKYNENMGTVKGHAYQRPLAASRGTSLNILRPEMDLSSSWHAASHFGTSGDAIASAREHGSSGLVMSISVDKHHS